jgi:uncharacterized lipoprotein YddW (UPF0748 family)
MIFSKTFMLSAGLRSAAAVIAAMLVLALSPLRAQDEVRALWVVRTTLSSPSAIATMVASAKTGGFNTLLVQIRGRSDAYSQHGLEPRASALAGRPDFDPLADVYDGSRRVRRASRGRAADGRPASAVGRHRRVPPDLGSDCRVRAGRAAFPF